MKNALLVFSIFLIATPFSANAASERVTNGGFETGDLTGWTATPASAGSKFGADKKPHTGNFSVVFAGFRNLDDSISQVVATTAGRYYALSFFATDIERGLDHLQVLWDGVSIFDVAPVQPTLPPATTFGQFTFQVFASSATTLLEFRGYDGPAALYVDDISVTAPEPTTAVQAMAAGSLLLALGRVRGASELPGGDIG